MQTIHWLRKLLRASCAQPFGFTRLFAIPGYEFSLGVLLSLLALGCTAETVESDATSPDVGVAEDLLEVGGDSVGDSEPEVAPLDIDVTPECHGELADCDGDSSNGCETDLNTSADHCGACGAACGAAGKCASGRCDAVVQLVGGDEFTCARRELGGVACWGANFRGQLGNGTTSHSKVPVAVLGISDAVDLAAGSETACAVRAGGQVLCWGENDTGVLGDGTLIDSSQPVVVGGLSDAVQVAVSGFGGSSAACAVLGDESVWCWGTNDNGQLGAGVPLSTLERTSIPLQVPGLVDAVDVSAGDHTLCALHADDTVSCWGQNGYGQAGSGSMVETILSPELLTGLPPAQAIASGSDHHCAILRGGGVRCWGIDWSDQLGVGNTRVPLDPQWPLDTVELALGAEHSCLRRATGDVLCRGTNEYGALGAASPNPAMPWRVVGLSAAALGAGLAHTCAVGVEGGVQCWGRNRFGAVGDGNTTIIGPTLVGSLPAVQDLAAGRQHTCAVDLGGHVYCWGRGDYGQLGDQNWGGEEGRASLPGQIMTNISYSSVEAFEHTTCATNPTGPNSCWGYNDHGQVGVGGSGNRAFPEQVGGLPSDVGPIMPGGHHSCAVAGDGLAYCWGLNRDAQLGTGVTSDDLDQPTLVSVLTDVIAIDPGHYQTCAIRSIAGSDPDLWCWGLNKWGSVGSGASSPQLSAFHVLLTGPVAQVSTAQDHTCARKVDGSVLCWGTPYWDRLGGAPNGDGIAIVENVANAVDIDIHPYHGCAVHSGGLVSCWGMNRSGQLGSPASDSSPPVVVANLSGIADVETGDDHTCALDSLGRVWCWGDNSFGQIGVDSVPMAVRTPTAVVGLSLAGR